MLDGEGAFLYGGRWNSQGTRLVYLGNSLAQASVELLVHLNSANVLRQYMVMQLTFDESLMEHIDASDLPDNWASQTMNSSVQAVGDEWVMAGSSLILQVPSAAITGEYNFLLNPIHKDFNKLKIGAITPFYFDQRLIK